MKYYHLNLFWLWIFIFIVFISALTKVYEKANSVVSYDVSCPTWLHKYIIGRKGAGIQKLTGELQKVMTLRKGFSGKTFDKMFLLVFAEN